MMKNKLLNLIAVLIIICNSLIFTNAFGEETDTFDISMVTNENIMQITSDLNLFSSYTSSNGNIYNISWSSSDSNIIMSNGKVNQDENLHRVVLTAVFTLSNDSSKKNTKQFDVVVLPKGETIEKIDFEDYADELRNKTLNGYDKWKVTIHKNRGADTVLGIYDDGNKYLNAVRYNVNGTAETPEVGDERAQRYFYDNDNKKTDLIGRVYIGARIKYNIPQNGVFTFTQPFNKPGPFQFHVLSSTGKIISEIRVIQGNTKFQYAVPNPTEAKRNQTKYVSSGVDASNEKWANIGMLIDTSTKKYDLYIDGRLIKGNLTFAHKDGFYPNENGSDESNYHIGGIMVGSLRNDGISDWCVDDVIVRRVIDSKNTYSLSIDGASKVTYVKGEDNTYRYEAKLTDALGNNVDGNRFNFYIEDSDVAFENGILTTNNTIESGKRICLKAVSVDDSRIVAEKKIVFLDYNTYIDDELRLGKAVQYAKNVLNKGTDSTERSPLFADGIDKKTGEHIIWKFDNNSSGIEMSDLANQGNLMKSLVALSNLTGDDAYKNRVENIYDYYLKHYISQNGMVYWGGHETVNLLTGDRAYSVPEIDTHELKNHFPYFEPFFNVDSSKAENIIKSTWVNHIENFNTLLFNRHAKFSETNTDLTAWYNTSNYNENSEPIIVSEKLPFKSTANDLIYMACKLYQKTGENEALIWAKRLHNKFVAIRDKNTNLGGGQFTTAACAETDKKLSDLEKRIGKHWWEVDPIPDSYTYTGYGDRARNQFEDPLINAGIIPESKRNMIREYNVLWSAEVPEWNYGSGALADIMLAETIGIDNAEGREVLINTAKGMSAWANLAYMPETNKFKALWADGTDMTGVVMARGGYYGHAGRVIEPIDVTTDYLYSYSKMYLDLQNINGLDNEKNIIWSFIRNVAKANNLGELGINEPGDKICLNFETNEKDPIIVYALSMIYRATGNDEYIKLARKVADNMVDYCYNDGYFTEKSKRYIRFDSECMYAILLLDSSIRGEYDLIDDPIISKAFYSSNYYSDNGNSYVKGYDTKLLWPAEMEEALDEMTTYEKSDFDDIKLKEKENINSVSGWFEDENSSMIGQIVREPNSGSSISFEAANKVLEVSKTTNAEAKLIKKLNNDVFSDVLVFGKIDFKLRVMAENTLPFKISLANDLGEGVVDISFANGIMSSDTVSKDYTIGEWVDLEVSLDLNTHKYSLYVNNKIVGEELTCKNQSESVTQIIFSSIGDAQTKFYVDDVVLKSNSRCKEIINMPFSLISSENPSHITKKLNFVDSYNDGYKNYSVTWCSGDLNTITENGDIIRGKKDKDICVYACLDDGINVARKGFKVTVAAAGEEIDSEDFEEVTEENSNVTSLSNWRLYLNSYKSFEMTSTIVKDPTTPDNVSFENANKALMLHRTSASSVNHRPRMEFDKSLEGKFIVKTRVYTKTGFNNNFSINLLNSQRCFMGMLFFNMDEMMVYTEKNGGLQNGTQKKYAYKCDEWVDVRFEIDTNSETYDFYLNGEKINNVPCDFYYRDTTKPKEYSSTDIAFIEYDIKKETKTEGIWYIDDIYAQYFTEGIYSVLKPCLKNNVMDNKSTIDNIYVKKISDENIESKLIVAVYKNEEMKACRVISLDYDMEFDDTEKFPLDIDLPYSDEYTVRVFILDGFKTLVPIKYFIDIGEKEIKLK